MAVNIDITGSSSANFIIGDSGTVDVVLQGGGSVVIAMDSSSTGPQGPPGDDANLPAGTVNQVLRHNGTDWVATSRMLISDDHVEINQGSNLSYALRVRGAIEPLNSTNARVIGEVPTSGTIGYGSAIFGSNLLTGLQSSTYATQVTAIGSNIVNGYNGTAAITQSTFIGANLINKAKNASFNILLGDNMIPIGNANNYIEGIIGIGTRNFYYYIGSPTENYRHANTAIGSDNFFSLQYGLSNVAIGDNNLRGTTSSDSSIAIGRSTFHPYSQVLNHCIVIGKWAGLYYTSGTHTALIFIGTEAARSANMGNYSIAIGFKAGRQNTAATGYQICLGYQAGRSTSKHGIFIGKNAGNGNAYSGVMVLGDSAQADADNQIAIGSSSYTDVALFLTAAGKDDYAMRYDEAAGKVVLKQDRITASATLDFPATAAGSESVLNITVTGAVDGDAVSLGVPNAAASLGGQYFAWVSAPDTVSVRFSNTTSASIDPPASTFKVIVSK